MMSLSSGRLSTGVSLRSRIFAALTALAVLSLLRLAPLWDTASLRLFDQISTTAPARPDAPGIVIVAIDEPSFAEIGQPWPWPRDLHAELIVALRAAGASAIGMDIVFAEPSEPEADSALAQAARADTVFAADETYIDTPQMSGFIVTEPILDLLEQGARTGIASVTTDRDGVLRRMPVYADGFIAQLAGMDGGDHAERMMQYFGPAGSYPRVSYYQALDPDTFLPDGYFKDRVVLVGYSLQATADISTGGSDAFETPFTLRTRRLMPGVEVQATIFDNLRHDLSIRPVSWFWGGVLLLVGGGLAAGLMITRQRRSQGVILRAAMVGLLVLAIIILSWVLLRYGRVWVSPLDPVAGLLGVFLVLAALDYASEQRLRHHIHGAFSQYLSPDMVSVLIQDPSQLKLGGETKTLSILFLDIRGFTGLSERFRDDPEQLTSIVNGLMTPLSDIILEEGGTIDKYIGDCIMAFWNAPLDQANHADRALRAALRMQEAMPEIVAGLSARYGGERPLDLKIGIGLNSGSCVVGNMGSDRRFDYSLLGDAVNVAARIEGQTKDLGHPILLGESMKDYLSDPEAVQAVQTVTLKGREEPITLFAPG